MKVRASEVIIVEGTLIFFHEKMREKLELKIFIETEEDVRLSRRIMKGVRRSSEEEIDIDALLIQYFKFVKPSYEKYVEPIKCHADIVIPNYGFSTEKLDLEGY